jgi:hypothetical protein
LRAVPVLLAHKLFDCERIAGFSGSAHTLSKKYFDCDSINQILENAARFFDIGTVGDA